MGAILHGYATVQPTSWTVKNPK